jgi:hypothetical protein
MTADRSRSVESPLGRAAFFAAVALQVLWLPFLATMILFGALGLPHYSSSDKLFFLIFAAYLPAFPLAAIVGARYLRRQAPLTATAIVLSPILLLLPSLVLMALNTFFPAVLGSGAGS